MEHRRRKRLVILVALTAMIWLKNASFTSPQETEDQWLSPHTIIKRGDFPQSDQDKLFEARQKIKILEAEVEKLRRDVNRLQRKKVKPSQNARSDIQSRKAQEVERNILERLNDLDRRLAALEEPPNEGESPGLPEG